MHLSVHSLEFKTSEILTKWLLWNSTQKPQNSLVKFLANLCLLLNWYTECLLSVSNMDQCTLSFIVVRGILDAYTHYCRTVIADKCVDYWIFGNISVKTLLISTHLCISWISCISWFSLYLAFECIHKNFWDINNTTKQWASFTFKTVRKTLT